MIKNITKNEFKWWQAESDWYFDKHPIMLLHWPKGTGKTLFGTYMLKEYAIKNPGTNCVGIFLGAFLAHFDANLLSKLFANEQHLISEKGKGYLRLTNGSEIRFLTATQEAIRSQDIQFAFLDEYTFFKKQFYEALISGMNPKKGKILGVGTPMEGAPTTLKNMRFFKKPFILNVPEGTAQIA